MRSHGNHRHPIHCRDWLESRDTNTKIYCFDVLLVNSWEAMKDSDSRSQGLSTILQLLFSSFGIPNHRFLVEMDCDGAPSAPCPRYVTTLSTCRPRPPLPEAPLRSFSILHSSNALHSSYPIHTLPVPSSSSPSLSPRSCLPAYPYRPCRFQIR